MIQFLDFLIGILLGLAMVFYIYPKRKNKLVLVVGVIITVIYVFLMAKLLIKF